MKREEKKTDIDGKIDKRQIETKTERQTDRQPETERDSETERRRAEIRETLGQIKITKGGKERNKREGLTKYFNYCTEYLYNIAHLCDGRPADLVSS